MAVGGDGQGQRTTRERSPCNIYGAVACIQFCTHTTPPSPTRRRTKVLYLSTSPPFSNHSNQLPGNSPTLVHPASLASPAAARLRTPDRQ